MKAEERGGRPDWEAKIPRAIKSLQTDAPAEMRVLLNELNPDFAERSKMTKVYRRQIKELSVDKEEIHTLMYDESIKELQTLSIKEIMKRSFRTWNKLRSEWYWDDADTSSEEILWERIRGLVDKWPWYGKATDLAKREVLTNWRLWEDWQKKERTPQR
jgi:hypothetical protein